jgi:hypothetical protein
MMHLFTSCSAAPLKTSLYLRHIPKKRDKALSFHPDLIEGNTGWGLHFVEGLNSSLAVTVMFSISVILGIVSQFVGVYGGRMFKAHSEWHLT